MENSERSPKTLQVELVSETSFAEENRGSKLASGDHKRLVEPCLDSELSVKMYPEATKTRKTSGFSQYPLPGGNRNHYTQVRAQYLKTIGGVDWGSELSDDVTMTDTFSMESIYTVEKVVAAYDANVFSREVNGFLNRLNFSVLNYENLRDNNLSSHPKMSKVLPRMYKPFPLGGYQNSGDIHLGMSLKQWQNLLANSAGWILALVPVACLVATASSTHFWMQFINLYILFSLFTISVLMLVVDFRNKQIFFHCKLCSPVPVTSENLKGFRNFFKDMTEEQLSNLKSLKKTDREVLVKFVNNPGERNKSNPKTIRVMFYSVEYYQKFIQVPRFKLCGLVFLNAVFFTIAVILTVRKN